MSRHAPGHQRFTRAFHLDGWLDEFRPPQYLGALDILRCGALWKCGLKCSRREREKVFARHQRCTNPKPWKVAR